MDGQLLSETFVELTDTMVADFDVIDFLHVLTDRSVQLLDVSAAGLLLADPRGELRVVAASSEAARLLELFQIQSDQGPCLDCFRTGQPIDAEDLAASAQRWPRFAPAPQQAGFAAVQALPMRLRNQVIGALNLFRASPGAFPPADKRVGQALADVATISLLHERSMRHSDTLNEQLQTALNSRVIIEQAKGKLAERLGLDMDQAFTLLRDFARNRNRRLSDLAQAFIDGSETLTSLTPGRPASSPGRAHRPYRRPRRRRSTPPSYGHQQCRERVGFQNSAAGPELGFYAARSYSLMRPPRMGRRLIRFREEPATGWSGRGGRSWRLRWGRRPL